MREQRLVVELLGEEGAGRRPAIADVALVGRSEVGDDVVVNVEALDLGLGSGGFDIVHVNLTRGLAGQSTEGANVMKLNYTSMQHAIVPVEDEALRCRWSGRSRCSRSMASWAPSHGPSASQPGGEARLCADRGRRAARGALTDRRDASRARSAGRPPDRRRGLRWRGRGDHHGWSAPPRAHARSDGMRRYAVPARESSARARGWVTAAWWRSTPLTWRWHSAARRCWWRGCPRAMTAPATAASPTTP